VEDEEVIFLNRQRRGPDPYLTWKVWLFLGAAIVAVLGIGLESSLLIFLAILLLGIGGALRFFVPQHRDGEPGEAEDES